MKKSLHTLNKELHGEKAGNYLAALVDNRLKSLDYILYNPHQVAFVDYSHPDGRRTYIRSLSFLLQKAVREVFPQAHLRISYSVENALYCDLEFPDNREVTPEDMAKLEAAMKALVRKNLPSKGRKSLRRKRNAFSWKTDFLKRLCCKKRGHFYASVYYLGNTSDTFYGPLVPSTGYLTSFSLCLFHTGFCCNTPSPTIRSG